MPCGCKKRMKKLEESHPKVADAIRPAHEVAMKVMDKIDELRGAEPDSEGERSR